MKDTVRFLESTLQTPWPNLQEQDCSLGALRPKTGFRLASWLSQCSRPGRFTLHCKLTSHSLGVFIVS